MKKTISATIDCNLVKWIDNELKNSHKYRNKSHLVEIALSTYKKKGK